MLAFQETIDYAAGLWKTAFWNATWKCFTNCFLVRPPDTLFKSGVHHTYLWSSWHNRNRNIKPACKSSLQCWASISVSLAPLASHSTDWAWLAYSRMDTKKLKSTVKMWYMSVDNPVKIQSWTSYHQPASWGYAAHSLQLPTMYCSSFKFSFFNFSLQTVSLSSQLTLSCTHLHLFTFFGSTNSRGVWYLM